MQLDDRELGRALLDGRDELEAVVKGPVDLIAYPHGVAESFSAETEKAVADAGCPFAFAVQASDITVPLAETRRFALPRHNCNAFPYGSVSYGDQVPA